MCTGHCADQPDQKHHKKRQTASQHAEDLVRGAHQKKHLVEKQSVCVVCGVLICCIMQLILLSLRCENQVLTDIFVRATLKCPMWDMISIVAEQMVWPSSGVLAIRQSFWLRPHSLLRPIKNRFVMGSAREDQPDTQAPDCLATSGRGDNRFVPDKDGDRLRPHQPKA